MSKGIQILSWDRHRKNVGVKPFTGNPIVLLRFIIVEGFHFRKYPRVYLGKPNEL